MKKLIVFLHQGLGVALALLLLAWFASGLVLHFVPFPTLTSAARLAALPPLQVLPGCCLTAQQAAQRADLLAIDARLGLYGGVPVWRLLARDAGGDGTEAPHWEVLDARSAAVLPPLSESQAGTVAEAFSGRRMLQTEWLQRDAWTLSPALDPYRPLVKVTLEGDDGLELYVSAGAAEVVRDTRLAQRFWSQIGSVPHWLDPTPSRSPARHWHQVTVGLLLAAGALALGLGQWWLHRRQWLRARPSGMRWYQLPGLVVVVCMLSWIFSGPLGLGPSDAAAHGSTPVEASLDPNVALAQAELRGLAVRELGVLQVAGESWYRLREAGRQMLLRADDGAALQPLPALPEATVAAALAALRPDTAAPLLRRLDAYDDLYYVCDTAWATQGARPLPVWRAEWADGARAYADPRSARVLLRSDATAGWQSWQRWRYQGVHSLESLPQWARPWLCRGLVLGLSLLGMALCMGICVGAWRALRAAWPWPSRQALGAEVPVR
ncbi:hypothetical protein AAFF27_17800 [Xylophilus sp. GW821-FHT01B05]